MSATRFMQSVTSTESWMRLADGSSSKEGRVEIFYNGQWGTVCDDSWDLNDANAVCYSLGLGHALEAVSNAGFGEGTGMIVLGNVACTGIETNILLCARDGIGNHGCTHSEDVGVRCYLNSSGKFFISDFEVGEYSGQGKKKNGRPL